MLQAALRELEEETGLLPADVTLCDGFQHKEDYRFTSGKGDDRVLIRKAVTYFLAEASRTDVRLSEHEASDYVWLPLPEALTKVRYAARRRMLEAAARAAGCVSGLGENPPDA